MKRFVLPILSLSLAASFAHADGVALADSGMLSLQMSDDSSPLALDKSLVEREQELIEADSAMPEASPTTAPFSLCRPESIV